MNKLVSIIIINWNGKHYLHDCLASVYNQSYKNIEVVLVDNDSVDGSVEYIKKHFPKTKIIVNKKNLGFAEPNNIAYRSSRGEYVLFLNNDTRVTGSFLTELIKVLQSDKKIGGVQSKILLMDSLTKLDSVGAFLTPTGFLYHYGVAKKNSPKYNKEINLYSAKGACMMFKREVLEKIKIDNEVLDGRYFAYFEETDLCHRVWLAGYRIVFAPKSIIYHKMGGTSRSINNASIQYHSFKNRINSYLKNFDKATLLKILPLHLFLCETYAILSLLEGNVNLFLAIQKAIIWNIRNIKQTIRKRVHIQKRIRAVTDKFLFSSISKPVKLNYYYYLFKGLEHYKDKQII